jgi:hypothetical protein
MPRRWSDLFLLAAVQEHLLLCTMGKEQFLAIIVKIRLQLAILLLKIRCFSDLLLMYQFNLTNRFQMLMLLNSLVLSGIH